MWLLLFQPKNREVQIWVIFGSLKANPLLTDALNLLLCLKKIVIIRICFHLFTLEERYREMERSEQGFCIGLIESLDLDLGFHTGCIQFINSALYFKIILCFMAFLLNLKDAEKKYSMILLCAIEHPIIQLIMLGHLSCKLSLL